jgi:hypothetical protein
MSFTTLKLGSKGPAVTELQTLLENKLLPAHRKYLGATGHLEITGVFDEDTKECVIDFQINAKLKNDGKVGPNTWRALKGLENFNAYQEPKHVHDGGGFHCWAACTAMLKGITTKDLTPVPNVDFEQLGSQLGGLGNDPSNVAKFAAGHGFEFKQAANWKCVELCHKVNLFGRLALNIRGVTSLLTRSPNPDDSHWVILAGLRGDGTPKGTTLYLMNPSVVENNCQVVHTYSYLKSEYPQLTHQVMYLFNNNSAPIY